MPHPLVVHCKRDPYDVYIGRGRCPVTGEPGKWGNPFSHKQGTAARFKVVSLDEAIEGYRRWLWRRIKEAELHNDDTFIEELASLAGQRLGCWCAPKCCHGEVLARAAEWAAAEIGRRGAVCVRLDDHSSKRMNV